MKDNYSADSIKVLSDLDHIKTRKGMYIGEGADPRQLLSEIFDNAIDEVQAGFSPELLVTVDISKNIYAVRDWGRGIPHGTKQLENGEKKEVLEILVTKTNSGGKFDNSSYNYSSGLNGLGLTITNALSNFLTVTSYRAGKYVRVECADNKGVKLSKGNTEEPDGTEVIFQPNPKMFRTSVIPIDFILHRCITASALGYKARLIVDDKEYITDSDIFSLIKEEDDKISKYIDIPEIDASNKNGELMKVALRYTSDTKDRYFGYTNLLSNYLGGTHVQVLSKVISNIWENFIDKHKNLKPTINLKPSDYLVGLRAVCAVFISKPEFSSQTKEKLVVAKNYFDDLMDDFSKKLYKYLEENVLDAQKLIKRFEEYRIAQNALLSRKEINSLIKINEDSSDNIRRRSVVSKLVECTSKKREGTELFICLAGDTKVKLLNGTDVEIEKLVGKEDIWAYSVNEKGQFIPAKILRVFKTQEVSKLLKLTFSDGSIIKCTPEHRFMDRDTLSWVEARNLTRDQSMLTIKTKEVNGYVNVWIPMQYDKYNSRTKKKQGHWEVLHQRIAKALNIIEEYDGETIYNVHHKDFDRKNNDPTNLIKMPLQEHFKLHAIRNIETGVCKADFDTMSENSYKRMCEGSQQRTAEGIQRQRDATHKSWEKDKHNPNRTWTRYNKTEKFWQDVEKNKPLNSARMKLRWANLTEEEKAQAKQLNREGTMKRKRIQCVHMGQQLVEKGLEFTKENWKNFVWKNGYPSLNKAIEYFGSIEQFKEEIKNYNLKIVSIEEINYDEKIPVYCLTIDAPTHAFVLENGIVTHNCEGDSALGPYLYVRDKETQAVLPLRGKILNTTGKTLKEVIQNKEICDIANSIGCGIGANCDASKSRYDKIIISSDADPDGLQITCLVLALFVNLFPDMIKQGKIYVSLPPLYCWGDKESNYGWCNKVDQIPEGVKDVHRFKGLGEMNSDQLEYFLVNPKTRNVIQIEYPSDIDEFNKILGTSEGKGNLLKELGVIVHG